MAMTKKRLDEAKGLAVTAAALNLPQCAAVVKELVLEVERLQRENIQLQNICGLTAAKGLNPDGETKVQDQPQGHGRSQRSS